MFIHIKRFTLNYKMILFTVLLLLISILMVGTVSFYLTQHALNQKGKTILKNSVASAILLIDKYAQDVDYGIISLEDAQELVKIHLQGPMNLDGTRTIRNPMDLGEHGYFIIYSTTGLEIMHPRLEGVNVWDYTDKNTRRKEPFYLVQDKVDKALKGGGFTRYTWDLPNDKASADKIAYSMHYEKWGWVVSAGTYMMDFNQEAQLILNVTLLVSVIVLGISMLLLKRFMTNITRPVMALERAMAAAKQGNYLPVEVPKRNDEIARLVAGYNRMIRAIEIKDQKLHHYAYYDTLTGLPNRLKATEDMYGFDVSVADASHLVLLTIKNFKSINAVYGSAYGDKVIQVVGEGLYHYERSGWFPYRIAGNEFAFFIKNSHEENIQVSLKELCDEIRNTLEAKGLIHSIQFYAGGTAIQIADQSFNTCYQKATVALQFAKTQDDLDYVAYTDRMHQSFTRVETIEQHAEKAIREDGFEMYYQVKMNSQTDTIVGVEALARWFSPELGAINPGEFIPILSKSHLIVAFTKYTIKKVFEDYFELKKKYGETISVGINLSPLMFFHNDLLPYIKTQLLAFDIRPSSVILEITEDLFINDIDLVRKKIEDIRLMGIKIALDDFGSGFSSLNYLKSFELDEVKIDRSFISEIHQNDQALKILESIISISKELGYTVVAEGVENIEQLEHLTNIGCYIIQGYYYAKPEPLKRPNVE